MEIIFLVSVSLVFGVAHSDNSFNKPKDVGFDMLVFTQSWPQTSCWSLNNFWNHANDACSPCPKSSSSSDWIIHGLWPSNRKGSSPSHCSNMKFKHKLLDSHLKSKLNKQWPTLNAKVPLHVFWAHEWNVHGTCAVGIKYLNSIDKYFSTAVDLNEKYNVGRILSDGNILPGKSYHFYQLHSALYEFLGVNAFLKCTRHPESKKQYLLEVKICFNALLGLTHCADDNGYLSNCNRKYDIIYPEILKSC